MPQITINEISQSYQYNIANTSFCTVALPITASWGPAFQAQDSDNADQDKISWSHFPATQAGLEAFVSTYRSAASQYRTAGDYSYQIATTLLTSGYDILVCRLCPGNAAAGSDKDNLLTISAKYPGTFGNNLQVDLKPSKIEYETDENGNLTKVISRVVAWNVIVKVNSGASSSTPVENTVITFDVEEASDTILHVSEYESQFINITEINLDEILKYASDESITIKLSAGTDRGSDEETVKAEIEEAVKQAKVRYKVSDDMEAKDIPSYVTKLTELESIVSEGKARAIKYREWLFTNAINVYSSLSDKLAYSPNRIMSPWDDQDFGYLEDDNELIEITTVSPMHNCLLETAGTSRCAAAYIDIPKSCKRSAVQSYADTLSQANPNYATVGAIFAPWGQYIYTGTSKLAAASPSFLALLIQRAMIKNQSLQYEWIMPTSRTHNLNIGKLAYTVPQSRLDEWQSTEGVGINVITTIPDLGSTLWGNSTLYNVAPAEYQALANLSTRLLVNAIKNVVYKVGTSITYQYNNSEAYSTFYVGVSPLLETMQNAGAITDFKVQMSPDIDNLGSVNANAVVGKIYIAVSGVVSSITVDLVCLPAGTDLSAY